MLIVGNIKQIQTAVHLSNNNAVYFKIK